MTELPLSLVSPVTVSAETPNGVFYPFRPAGAIMLAMVSMNQPYLLYLNGEKEFACFRIRPGYSPRGSIITDIEFRVDLSSGYDAERETDPLGALVIQNGKASIMAYRMEDGFGDPFDMPIWGGFNSWTPDAKMGFKNWSIVARDGDNPFATMVHRQEG